MIRRHGRLYSKATTRGFEKMRARGIPQPPLRLEDMVARSVALEYEALFAGVVEEAKKAVVGEGVTVSKKAGSVVLVADASPESIMRALRELMGKRGPDVARLRVRLNAQLVAMQAGFMRDLLADADARTIQALAEMSLPAQEVFRARMAEMRELYLDSAEGRILGEADELKKQFLEKLTSWVGGETKELDVAQVVAEMNQTSARRARFFARDQFSRFNRSLMIASYRQADAPYVEWLTSNDERVRPEHQKRNHALYTMQGLVADPEWQSYNCRCGFAPVYEPTEDQMKNLRG